jgi:iron complex transport system substrate-binding protein
VLSTRRPIRRILQSVGLVVAGALVLAACGSGSGSGTGSTPSSAPAASGAFPATVTHKFGTTTVPAAPQRVVSLGYTDQDAILALGVVPVAIREFTGNKPSATWEWAQSKLNGQKPQVLPIGEVGTETIAALKPDLIIGISAGLTQAQYDTYSKIAPTIAAPQGFVDYGTPWQDATKITGQALGKTAEADKLIADLEAKITSVKQQYPNLAGKSVAAVRPSTNNDGFFVWSSQDLRGRFLKSLGMTIPQEFDTLAGQNFYATVSNEEISKLNPVNAVVLITASAAERQAMEAIPGWSQVQPVAAGHLVTLDDNQSAALSFSSVLSLPTVLDTLPKDLSAKLG